MMNLVVLLQQKKINNKKKRKKSHVFPAITVLKQFSLKTPNLNEAREACEIPMNTLLCPGLLTVRAELCT